MENLKEQLPKIVVGVAASSVLLFLLYKGLSGTTEPEQTTDPFKNVIDQSIEQSQKEKQGQAWMRKYVEEHLSGQLKAQYGILQRVDFNTLQKVMEVYAKCLLYQIRIRHQEQRIPILSRDDMVQYIEKLNEQLDIETQTYERAQNEVKSLAKISDQVFLGSYMEYTADKRGLRDAIMFSLVSPFKVTSKFSKDKAKEIFINSSTKAWNKV